jgi:hypothetical protein
MPFGGFDRAIADHRERSDCSHVLRSPMTHL